MGKKEKTGLKACPFCGAEAEAVPLSVDMGREIHWILCLGCGAESGTCKSAEEAREKWQRREGEGNRHKAIGKVENEG